MRRRVLLWMATWLPLPGLAQEAPSAAAAIKVAVFELKSTGIDEALALNLTETFTSEAGRIPGYQVIGRSEIKDLVGFEMEKQALGCGDEEKCFTEIGGTLGVDLLVTGSVGKVGESFVVNVKLIDVKAAATKSRVGESLLGRVELLPEFMRVAAWRLFEQPVPRDVDASYSLTKAKLEEELARKAGDAAKQAEAEKARAEAEKAKAEAEKAKAETEKARLKAGHAGQAGIASTAAAPTPTGPTHWTSIAQGVSIAFAVLGILGGGSMTGLSVWKQGEVGEAAPAEGGGSVYQGTRADAVLAETFETVSLPCYIVGGVGVAAAIVFSILEPEAPAVTSAVRLGPAPLGVALSF